MQDQCEEIYLVPVKYSCIASELFGHLIVYDYFKKMLISWTLH